MSIKLELSARQLGDAFDRWTGIVGTAVCVAVRALTSIPSTLSHDHRRPGLRRGSLMTDRLLPIMLAVPLLLVLHAASCASWPSPTQSCSVLRLDRLA